MRSQQSFLGAVLWLSYGTGCVDDLGTCDPAKLGRDSVLMNSNTVVYAGQAIINKACATGCHASTAKGKDRRGAPEGLDFDLLPVLEEKAAGTRKNAKGDTLVKLKSSQASGLQQRRNIVMSQRDEIWRQVQENLMPPGSSFEALLTSIYTAKDDAPCQRVTPFKKLPDGLARQAFRNWLACGVPIVEAIGEDVSRRQIPGTVGYQFPACPPEDMSSEPSTLETLLEGPFGTCSSCHPILSPPDFSSLDRLKTTLLDSTMDACGGKPFITPGDPSASFLYDVLALDNPGCNHTQMPAGGPYLTAAELQRVSDWITAGAPATAADLTDSSAPAADDSSNPSSDSSASP